MTASHSLQKVNVALTTATIFLLPLFFLPITSEFYEFNKQVLLIAVALVTLVIWTVRFLVDKQVRLTRSPFGLPLLGFGVVWGLSTYFHSPNKWEAIFEPGSTGTVLALTAIFFTAINAVHNKKHIEWQVNALLLSVGVLGTVTALFASGLFPAISPIGFMKSPLWTPVGNPFSTLLILVTGLVFTGIIAFKTRFNKAKNNTLVTIFALVATFLGSAFMMYRLFLIPGSPNRPVFLSQGVSWSIALEALKTAPILGTGPSTYLADFTRFRPISYNTTETWAVRFASSSNFYLQLLSTLGIAGLITYLLVVARSVQLSLKALRTTTDTSLHSIVVAATITLVLTFIAQIFFPVSLTVMAVVFFLLIITTSAFKQLGSSVVHEANIDIVAASESGLRTPVLPVISVLVAVVLTAITGYYLGRAYLAEVYFQQALVKAASNDGKATYDLLIKAYTTNPTRDAYRVAYAQTNLLLANSLAGKKDLSNDDRNTIGTLIQQSIREAKNAVALNPLKVTNVENLAGVYKSLIPLAKGADTWTVASYRAAIQLDPANPNLRIALGGVLYQLKQYDAAIQLFQQAVDLKPNLANAHYNLSAAYREKGDFQRAASAMQQVIANVNRDSADYTKATAELEELKKKLGQKTPTTTSETNAPAQTNLEAPKPLPTPLATPIEVPADLGPNTTTTPAVSPTTSPRPSTSPTPTR